MKLPSHKMRLCIGVELPGVTEACIEEVEEGSQFPFCARHRAMIEKAPRSRTCAGATVYDHAMRPSRVACQTFTGHELERLCAGCRVIEAKEKAKAKHAFQQECPTCGGRQSRPQQAPAIPPRVGSFPTRPSYGVPRESAPTRWPGPAPRPYLPPRDDEH